jgi:hypothetical protein
MFLPATLFAVYFARKGSGAPVAAVRSEQPVV